MRLLAAAGLAFGLLATGAAAQDANYWNLQYGPVGQLLGGQVIGSARDLSAAYYNPGGLALEEDTAFLLSTQSFQAEYVSSIPTSPAVEAFDVSSLRVGTFPTLVAGGLPRGWLGPRTRMAWSFLTRQKLDVRLGERLQDPFEVPGGESAAEQYTDHQVTEGWGGLTLAYELSETLGVGATVYGVYRSQFSRNELSFQALSADQAALTGLGVTEYSYYHFRALAKLGVAWRRGDLQLGLNVTTPSAALFGRGRAGYTASRFGTDTDGDGVVDPPVLVAGAAEDVDAYYRSSWALGGGIAWQRGATRWQGSAEWFAPVGRFTAIDVPADGGFDQGDLTQELRSVFNAGLGVEHDFGDEVVLYGAALTDFSAAPGSDPTVNATVTTWDLYHLSGGVKFHVAGSRFTLGATLTFGGNRRTLRPILRLPAALAGEGSESELDVKYRRLVVLLGFLFGKGR